MNRSLVPLSGLALVALAALVAAAPAARADTLFTGEDLNAGPGNPTPNSNAAAASFDSAASTLGMETTINFENAPAGAFSSLTAAPGVTITGSDYQGNDLSINSSPSFASYPPVGGFNTTPGGTNYLNMNGGMAIFAFAAPIQAFGLYLSGVQTNFYQDTVSFSDGTSQSINAIGVGTTSSHGAVDFVGFTDPGKSISSVTINAGTPLGFDEIGLDDVRFVPASAAAPAVPEAGTLSLLALGLLPIGLLLRARRRVTR